MLNLLLSQVVEIICATDTVSSNIVHSLILSSRMVFIRMTWSGKILSYVSCVFLHVFHSGEGILENNLLGTLVIQKAWLEHLFFYNNEFGLLYACHIVGVIRVLIILLLILKIGRIKGLMFYQFDCLANVGLHIIINYSK